MMETPNKEADVPALPPEGYRGTVLKPRGCLLLPRGSSKQGEGDIPGVVPLGLSQPCDPTPLGWI